MTISRFERYSQSRERALKLCFPAGRPCVHVIAVSGAGARRLYCFQRCNTGCSPRARKPGPSTRRPLRATERDTAPRRAKSVPVARCAAEAGALAGRGVCGVCGIASIARCSRWCGRTGSRNCGPTYRTRRRAAAIRVRTPASREHPYSCDRRRSCPHGDELYSCISRPIVPLPATSGRLCSR